MANGHTRLEPIAFLRNTAPSSGATAQRPLSNLRRHATTPGPSATPQSAAARQTQNGHSTVVNADNIEALWLEVLSANTQDAMLSLGALRDKVAANTSKKKVLRKLQGLANRMEKAGRRQVSLRKGGHKDGAEWTQAHANRDDLQNQIKQLVAEEPWLEETEIGGALKTLVGKGEIPLEDRLSAFTKSVESELENVADLGDELSLQVQLAMSRMTRSQQLSSNVQKRFHDTAMAVIGNIRG